MRMILTLATAAVAAGLLAAAAPAHARTCKDTVTAKARSAAQVSDDSRLRRARDKAISNWSARARDTYGWAYRFWRRSDERKVECGGGEGAKHCTASAKPCRLI
ncbi:MAG: hypothetical protein HC868_15945 [Sphingomonadales bacterium]|nr:hypothetical protein [Sphingomonadales bacterium]